MSESTRPGEMDVTLIHSSKNKSSSRTQSVTETDANFEAYKKQVILLVIFKNI